MYVFLIMNRNNDKSKTSFLITSLFVMAITFFTSVENNIYGTQTSEFKASLTGSEEVPPVDTEGKGTASLQVDVNTVRYQINALNTGKVTAVYIHNGQIGENGDPIASLYKSKDLSSYLDENLPNFRDVTADIQKSSTFSASGNFQESDLIGPLEGKKIQDLITMIKNGDVYVNVHTQNYPNGEIRGQLSADSD